MDRNGYLRVDTDASLTYYPYPYPISDGSLVGFKNNSRSTVYSLRLTAKSGLIKPFYDVCSKYPYAPNGGLHATNVTIVNVPEQWNRVDPPFIYYNACVGGQWGCPVSPYGEYPYWGTSCDVVFTGGVPKGGSTYFTADNANPNYPYFNVSANTVVPYISFQDAVVKGQTATATLTLSPSSSPYPVTLNLTTTTGTGSAVFTATNSTTMTIPANTATPVAVQIRGTDPSSTVANIELSASVNGVERVVNFSVIWVTISSMLTSGTLSADDDAATAYHNSTGTQYLGSSVGPA
ncbi:MAG: hypothetical protein ACE14M_15825 [Terriglobales bacterium]